MPFGALLRLPFLQLLQFYSEKEKPLPFGKEICSFVAWEVLIYSGRRHFRLSSISLRAMWNCGSLHVNMSTFLYLLHFCLEEEYPLPFGTYLRSETAWKVLSYCGSRRFRLSSIAFRAVTNKFNRVVRR